MTATKATIYLYSSVFLCVLIALASTAAAAKHSSNVLPFNISRASATWDWCDCGTGLNSLEVWPDTDRNSSIKIAADGEVKYARFPSSTATIGWKCDGMQEEKSSTVSVASAVWSL